MQPGHWKGEEYLSQKYVELRGDEIGHVASADPPNKNQAWR